MKIALTVVLFLLFTIGVIVDGYEVSVMEGDSVTLKSGVTKRQTDEGIEWRFSGTRIAKISSDSNEIWVKPDGSFEDRLKLDSQTGDLKISNIRTTDSGQYKVKISRSENTPPEMIFTVKVVSADEVKPVLEGDSVTLCTGLTDIKRDDVIQWRYGQQKSPVAEISGTAGIFNTYDGPDERFRDRLKLDHQTGSLTITNTRTTDSGDYEVEISRGRYTIHHTESFSVTVSGALKSVSVKEGETVTLPITKLQKDDLIQWMFGETVIAEIHIAAQRFYISDVLDKSFRDRLKLDHQTGSLIITNTRTTDSGLYEVKIRSSRRTINRRITVTVTGLGRSDHDTGLGRSDHDTDPGLSPGLGRSDHDTDPGLSPGLGRSDHDTGLGRSDHDTDPGLSPAVPDAGLSPAAVAGIVVVVLLLLAAAVTGVIFYCHKMLGLEGKRAGEYEDGDPTFIPMLKKYPQAQPCKSDGSDPENI